VTPERWREVQRLLHEALGKPVSERAAFLEQACAGDPELRSEVASLLSSAEEAGDFLEVPPEPATAGDNGEEEPPRGRIGPYRVDRLLGRGGMGHVYLAVRADEQYRKRVAIKVVKRGTDTDFVLRRFRQERQILAGLDHPNIARLLDGGNTDDGLPYFVMEYVEGEPITTFCERCALSIPERLALFRTVCGAVQFAHQNLVVHRDLKPGNILVTANGVPKLLDFGIAKLLNPELAPQAIDMTVAGVRLFTPDYASPEQIQGERITTASDVYSLGVLLYELLTGQRPYRVKSRTPEEIGKQVVEAEPEKPSLAVTRPLGGDGASGVSQAFTEPQKLRRLLSGDLDTIVLKAMRKEPHRRYASVEQLSEDLRRHLEGLPVTARKDTVGYRAEKFLRRHKAGAAAGVLVLLSLLVGIAATSWEARIAWRERQRAERRLKDVRQLTNSFLFEFHNAIANLAGSTPARELLVRRALEYLGTLANEAGKDPSLKRELAEAYEKLGQIQGGTSANLGDTAGSIASYRAALDIREESLAADPGNLGDLDALAGCLETLAGILGRAGGEDESFRLAQRALAVRDRLVKADPKSRAFRSGLARAHFFLSNQLFALNRAREQIAEMEKAREIYEALAVEDPKDLNTRRSVALTHKYLASARFSPEKAEPALEGYRKSEAIERELVAADPTNALYKQDLSHSYAGIGEALFALRRVAEGAESYRKAIALRKELANADPRNAGIREALARGYLLLGRQHALYGDPRAALESIRQAIPIFEDLDASDPGVARRIASLAECQMLTGTAHERIARKAPSGSESATLEWLRAEESYRKARAVFEDLGRQGKLVPQAKEELENVRAGLERVSAALLLRGAPR
jgi:tetratricopeptide (TPR) repeat protein/tRNA A-37 threonylcarbamoyl transferase component Bud32